MSETNKLTVELNEFSFRRDHDYLDVTVHPEGWLELRIETSDSFAILTEKEVDLIAEKLKEALRQTKTRKNVKRRSQGQKTEDKG